MEGYRFNTWEDYKRGCDVLLALKVEGVISEHEYKRMHKELDRICIEREIVKDHIAQNKEF